MRNDRKYQVMLLPEMEIVERACSLLEANAWTETYNHVIGGDPKVAVISEEMLESEML